MKLLYKSKSINDYFLAILKNEIKSNNICYIVKNQYLSGPMHHICAPEVWVNNEDLDKSKLLKEHIANHHNSKRSWFCKKCNMKIEKEFNVCWKCSSSRQEFLK